jgi:hypothetical protein
MTPKEKAQELVIKFEHPMGYVYLKRVIAKQCAWIVVDECIKHEKQIVEQIKSLQLPNSFIAIINEGSFWRQVKHEIENI